MTNELTSQIIFAIALLGFISIRLVSHRLAAQPVDKGEYKESRLIRVLRGGGGLLWMGIMISYMVYPRWLAWAVFPLPVWPRWIGAALALVTLPALGWVQWALGKNFSAPLHIREGRTLVTKGPYRWLRHPMYTVLFIFGTGLLLLTVNWFIGVPLLVGLALVIFTQVGKEEATMIEQFGDEYHEYIKRTGRFLPRLIG